MCVCNFYIFIYIYFNNNNLIIIILYIINYLCITHGKNYFIEVFKNLARYKIPENNFVWTK